MIQWLTNLFGVSWQNSGTTNYNTYLLQIGGALVIVVVVMVFSMGCLAIRKFFRS